MRTVHVEVGEDTLAHARSWAQDRSWELLEKRFKDLDQDLLVRAALAPAETHEVEKGRLEGMRFTLAVIQDERNKLLTPRNR